VERPCSDTADATASPHSPGTCVTRRLTACLGAFLRRPQESGVDGVKVDCQAGVGLIGEEKRGSWGEAAWAAAAEPSKRLQLTTPTFNACRRRGADR
jgi:hypothetical protein